MRNLRCFVFLILAIVAPLLAKAQNSSREEIVFKKLGITFSIQDTPYYFRKDSIPWGGSQLTVRKGRRTLFRQGFMRIAAKPTLIALASRTDALLINTWSGGAHCCLEVFYATYDSTGFRLVDSLNLWDGDYKLKDLDHNGQKKIVDRIDYFRYGWTAFTGSGFNTTIYQLGTQGFIDVTKEYPSLVSADIRSFLKQVRETKPKISQEEISETLKDTDEYDRFISSPDNIGYLKQNLACLLIAYLSIDKEAEGWTIIKKDFPYKGRDQFLAFLKNEAAESLRESHSRRE